MAALAVFAAAALVLALPPLRRATRAVLGSPDALVPLGLYVVLDDALGRLLALVPWLSSSRTVIVLQTSVEVSVWLLLSIVLALAAGAWTTLLLLDLAAGRRVDLLDTLRRLPRAFLPALAVGLTGYVPLFLLLLLLLVVVAGTEGGAMVVVLPAMLIATVVWNLWTAGLLPHVLGSKGRLLARMRGGFASARRGVRAWALPVTLQLALLGVVTFVSVSYTKSGTTDDGSRTSSVSRQSWNVHAKWTGGYDADSKWPEQYAAAIEARTRALPSTLVWLAMALVAVVVKLHVIRVVFPPAQAPPSRSDDGPPTSPARR